MNLFLHYAFDRWMKRTYPQCPFARYADDAVTPLKLAQQRARFQQPPVIRANSGTISLSNTSANGSRRVRQLCGRSTFEG